MNKRREVCTAGVARKILPRALHLQQDNRRLEHSSSTDKNVPAFRVRN